MLSQKEFRELYDEMRDINEKNDKDENYLEKLHHNMVDYIRMKVQEISAIFKKFDLEGILEDNSKVFIKNEEVKNYILILSGDIQLIEDEENNKILKTISAGNIFGHKIKTCFNYTGIAKNQTHILSIEKTVFDSLIEKINTRKEKEKFLFLKKFLPKIRLYSDDIIDSLKPYFIKEDYTQNYKLFHDNEFDEYVYLVIKGTIGCVKTITKIPNLKDKLSNEESHSNSSHIILEKFSKKINLIIERGDIFGMYSALKHQKNNYTAEVTSEKVSVYKIAKAHILLYFGGNSGTLPNTLKGIDTVQQNSLKDKIEYLEKSTIENMNEIKRFEFKKLKEIEITDSKIIVDETQITNYLKDAWKDLENVESKVQNFKTNLFNKNLKSDAKNSNILSKICEKDVECKNNFFKKIVKDHSKVMGFGTNRVVAKQLNKTTLSSSQLKGMSMLKNICDVKKKPSNVDIVEEKKEVEIKVDKNLARRPSRMKNLMGLDEEIIKSENRIIVDEPPKVEITNNINIDE